MGFITHRKTAPSISPNQERFCHICHFCQIRQIRQIRRLSKGALLSSHLHWPPSCCWRDFAIFAIFARFAKFAKFAGFKRGPSCLLICIGLQVVVGEILPYLLFLLLGAFLDISPLLLIIGSSSLSKFNVIGE